MLTCTATLEAEIITNWAAQVAEDLTLYQTIGHDWNRRYMWEAYPAPRTASTNSGSSNTGSTKDHVCRIDSPGDSPRATTNDVLAVRNQKIGRDHRLWRYEKTIYRNPHHQLEPPYSHLAYQRVVHLFVSVDEYGQVVDVSA